MKVIVLGATGLVGGAVLRLSLSCPAISRVTVISRRPIAMTHPKLHIVVADFQHLQNVAQEFSADALFCCLGTTIRKAGSQSSFRQVDYQLPMVAGQVFQQQGGQHFLLVSALGADSDSRIFYSKVKGELERDLQAMELPKLTIFRPSLLLGKRGEWRLGEWLGSWLLPPLAVLLPGSLKKYRAIPAEKVASAMVDEALGRDLTEPMEVIRITRNNRL